MLTYWFNYSYYALTAPFYYWFGKYAWFTEITVILADWGELIAIFFVLFLILNRFSFFKNYLFQFFTFVASHISFKNYAAILLSIFNFFSQFLNFFFTNIKQLFSYFFPSKK